MSPGSGLAATSSRLNRALRHVSGGGVSCLAPAAPLIAGGGDAVLVRGTCGPAATGVVRDARQAFTPPVPLRVCRACRLWLRLLAVEGCLGPRGGSGPLSPETRQSGRAYGSRWRGGAALGRSVVSCHRRSAERATESFNPPLVFRALQQSRALKPCEVRSTLSQYWASGCISLCPSRVRHSFVVRVLFARTA